MAAVRTLQVSTLPPWTTNGNSFAANVSFVFTHDRSMDVILQNQRGEGFVKQVFRLLLSTGCKTRAGGAGMVLDIGSAFARVGFAGEVTLELYGLSRDHRNAPPPFCFPGCAQVRV